MIEGKVNDANEEIIRLRLLPPTDNAPLEIDAVVDTGFSGEMTLSETLIQSLELSWLCRENGRLADGSVVAFDVYVANVMWGEHKRTVEVASADETLVGMGLIKGHHLKLDAVTGGRVTIGPLER